MKHCFTKIAVFAALAITPAMAFAATIIPLEWNTETTPGSRGDKNYSFTGKGTKAMIVTNETDAGNDLTMGNPSFLTQNGQSVTVTSNLEAGGWVYYTPVLESGLTYNLEFYCPRATFSFKIEEVAEDVTPPAKEPKALSLGKEVTIEQDQPYYFEASADGTLDIEVVYAPGDYSNWNSLTLVYSDAEHNTPLPNVNKTMEGSYPAYSVPVTSGETYYFFIAEPSYISANVNFTATVNYAGAEIQYDAEQSVSNGLNEYWFTGKAVNTMIATTSNEDLTIGGMLSVFKYGDPNEDVTVQMQEGENGNNYYLGMLQADAVYGISIDSSAAFKFTLEEGEYVEKDNNPEQVFPGTDLNWNNKTPYYYEATANGTVKLSISGFQGDDEASWSYPAMVYTDENHSAALDNVAKGSTSDIYYEFTAVEGSTYYFYFAEPNWIACTLAFTPDVAGPVYMEGMPTPVYDGTPSMPALFMVWNDVTLLPADDRAPLAATLTTPDLKEVAVELDITTYYPDEEDAPNAGGESTVVPDNALILHMASYIETYGAGTYSISFGSIVMDNNGAVNRPVEDATFIVTPMPTVSAIEPAINFSGDEIIINWDNEKVAYYNPEGADILIATPDYEEVYHLGENNGVSIDDNNNVVLAIANLGLTEGTTYQLIVPENFFFIGEDNEVNALIEKDFTAEASAIGSISSEISESAAIYNLQGVKMNKPVKGINIINGKKVVVR